MKKKFIVCLMVLLVAFLKPQIVKAALVKWEVNGHYYEVVDVTVTWYGANDFAKSSSYLGVQGHLATITSPEENLWITNTFGLGLLYNHWFGGYQPLGSPEPDGNWKWVTEELWLFDNWWEGEPSNSHGNEDGVILDAHSLPNGIPWNDLDRTWFTDGFVVEYPVPEPATIFLFSLGTIFLCRKNELSRANKKKRPEITLGSFYFF